MPSNGLCAVLYSEFDVIKGRELPHQVPSGTLSMEEFHLVSDYVITKPEVCGKVISISCAGRQLVGYPVCIEGSKFSRNALWFNLFFLVENVSDIARFTPIVEKIGRTFVTLEVDSNFLSERTSHDRLPGILEELYSSLSTTGECCIPVDDYTSLCLKLKPPEGVHPITRLILDHVVPALVRAIPVHAVATWDLTAQQILPHINGVNTVLQLSVASNVDHGLTKSCLQHLLSRGCITLLDVFQYSNVYACTPNIHKLAQSSALQRDCVRFVLRENSVAFDGLFRFYCALRPGMTLRNVCKSLDPELLGIVDHRKFIAFGLLHGFIRRVHEYPVAPSQVTPIADTRATQLVRLANGHNNFDSICCSTRMSKAEAMAALKSLCPSLIVISK